MAIFAYSRVSTKDQTTDNQKLDIERAELVRQFAERGASVSALARLHGLSRATVMRIVKPSDTAAA